MKKLYDGSLICAVLLAVFALLAGALARLDNMKWDDVSPYIEKQKEKEAKEKEEAEKPWYKKAIQKLVS